MTPPVSPIRTSVRSSPDIVSVADARMAKIWVARGVLAGYLALLLVLALLAATGPATERGLGLWKLRTQSSSEWIAGRGRDLLVDAARFLPVGMLVALSFRPRQSWPARILLIALPAVAFSLFLTYLVITIENSSLLSWPGLAPLAFPLAGALAGIWPGLEWRRGSQARRLLLPKLALLVGGTVLLCFLLLARATQPKPLPFEVETVTAADKSALYALFAGKNPMRLAEGETALVRLTQREANQLLSWALSLAQEHRRLRVEFSDERATIMASLSRSRSRDELRYVNITLGGRLWIDAGVPHIRFDALSLGKIRIPDLLVEAFSKVFERAARLDRDLLSVLSIVRDLRFQDAAVQIEYGPGNLARGFARSLFREDGPLTDIGPSLEAQVQRLVRSAPHLPTGEDRLGAALETAFSTARHRGGDAVMENQAAILALALLTATTDVDAALGAPVVSDSLRLPGQAAFRGLRLREREDWARRFLASASAEVLAVVGKRANGEPVAPASLREPFSFGALLAERAGAAFAAAAMRDQASAEALQRRLAAGYHIDDYFPQAADLPEGLSPAEFAERFGGEGCPAYDELADEISARVAASPAYQ